MTKYFLNIIIIIFLFQGISFADYYQWEDEQGTLHVTDYPPPANSAKNSKVHKYESESSNDSSSTNKSGQKNSKSASSSDAMIKKSRNEVILYTTSWCPWCKKARDYFTSRNISFTDYDIEKDKEAAERKKQLDAESGVPFAIINGRKIHGFSPSDYEKALQ